MMKGIAESILRHRPVEERAFVVRDRNARRRWIGADIIISVLLCGWILQRLRVAPAPVRRAIRTHVQLPFGLKHAPATVDQGPYHRFLGVLRVAVLADTIASNVEDASQPGRRGPSQVSNTAGERFRREP